MAARAAVVTGTLIRPGMSLNHRIYSRENIGAAVAGMKKAIETGGLPLTMATSHGAAYNDDALDTVGRITSVEQQEDGSATFEADVPDTSKGRDIAALVTGPKPFIKGISIRGRWTGDVVPAVGPNGEEAVTSDGLEIHGVDFTHRPGVEGAEITGARLAEAQVQDPSLIFESAEDFEFIDETGEPTATISETVDSETDALDRLHEIRESIDAAIAETPAPTPGGNYADPGYKADKKKRYPLGDQAQARAAWSYINMPKNQSGYTSAQLKRIKSKIKSAAKKFGIDIAKESAELAQEFTDLLEAYASSSFDNGAASISVSGYTDDAGKLAALGQRLALAAQGALYIVDPDADGDVDLVMPDGSTDSSSESGLDDDDDNNMSPNLNNSHLCTLCGGVLPDQAMFCPTCGQPVPTAESNDSAPDQTINEEATVPTDETIESTEATEVEAAPAITQSDVDAAVQAALEAAGVKPAVESDELIAARKLIADADAAKPAAAVESAATEGAPEAPAAVAAPVAEALTAERVQEMIAEAAKTAREEAIAEAVATFREAGGARKGLVNTAPAHPGAETSESSTFDAADMARMSNDEFRSRAWEAWESNLPSHLRSKLAEADAGYGAGR